MNGGAAVLESAAGCPDPRPSWEGSAGRRLSAWIGVVCLVLGSAAAIASSSADDWQPLPLLLLLGGSQVVSEVIVARQSMGSAPWKMTSAVPVTLSMVLLGPAPALFFALLALVADYVISRPPLDDEITNSGNTAIFVVSGALLANELVSGLSLSPSDPGFAVMVAGISLYVDLVSSLVNMASLVLSHGTSIRAQMRDSGSQTVITISVCAVLAGATAYAYGSIGIAAAIPLSLALLLQQHLMQSLATSEVRAKALRRQSEKLEELSASRGRLLGEVLRAEEKERKRLADALHDEALQELLFVRQRMAFDEPSTDSCRHAMDRAIRQLRGEISELHPAALEVTGLASAVEQFAATQAERAGFEVTVEVDRASWGEADQILFALAKEQVVNVAKHAAATQVSLTIVSREDAIVMEVCDDGSGMTAERPRAALQDGRIGLASSAQRIADAGGTVEIESAPGSGTLIRSTLPLEGAELLLDQTAPHSLGDRRGAIRHA